jgi:hypothetical protein
MVHVLRSLQLTTSSLAIKDDKQLTTSSLAIKDDKL